MLTADRRLAACDKNRNINDILTKQLFTQLMHDFSVLPCSRNLYIGATTKNRLRFVKRTLKWNHIKFSLSLDEQNSLISLRAYFLLGLPKISLHGYTGP